MKFDTSNPLLLEPDSWYGWQEIGNNHIAPPFACSPVFFLAVNPLKTGKGLLQISFLAAIHPIRPSRVDIKLRVTHHRSNCIVGTWLDADGAEHTGVLSMLTLNWLVQHCHQFISIFPIKMDLEYQTFCFGLSNKKSCPTQTEILTHYLANTFDVRDGVFQRWANEFSFGSNDPSIKLPPMPSKRVDVALDIELNPFEAYLIQRGFIPQQMESKWFIYCKDKSIVFRRSWTKFAVYEIGFEVRGNGVCLQRLVINRDPDQYTSTDDGYDKKLALSLLTSFLLKQSGEFPT